MTEDAFCTLMYRKMKIYLFSLGIVLILVGLGCLFFQSIGYVWIPSCTGNGGRWGPPEYYDGSAPDGWYSVWCGLASENGEVFFPLCPNSGSRLHGTWKTAIFIEEDFSGEVRVQNGMIVEKR